MNKFKILRLVFNTAGICLLIAGAALIIIPFAGRIKTQAVQHELMDSLNYGEAAYAPEVLLTEAPHSPEAKASPFAPAATADADAALEESPEPDASGQKSHENENFGELPFLCIGIMRIPKIDLELPVVEGLTEENLKYALAHMAKSAAIGAEGSCCIFGHRSYAFGKFFNRLDELDTGDKITIETAGGVVHEYVVIQKEILLPDDSRLLDAGLEGRILNLITCHPVRVATHRLVIRAEEITQ